MSQMLDLDDFPIGTLARTPSGRIGVVIKHISAEALGDWIDKQEAAAKVLWQRSQI